MTPTAMNSAQPRRVIRQIKQKVGILHLCPVVHHVDLDLDGVEVACRHANRRWFA